MTSFAAGAPQIYRPANQRKSRQHQDRQDYVAQPSPLIKKQARFWGARAAYHSSWHWKAALRAISMLVQADSIG
jgi:hypothetical protein